MEDFLWIEITGMEEGHQVVVKVVMMVLLHLGAGVLPYEEVAWSWLQLEVAVVPDIQVMAETPAALADKPDKVARGLHLEEE